MLFSEPFFLFAFLPIVLALYALLRGRARNWLLLAASLLFYAWGEPGFVPIMVASILVNYVVAIWIEQTRGTRSARLALALGIASDLSLLLYFKYAMFVAENLNALLGLAHAPGLRLSHIGLPLGISFFTFHKISYKVDVYRGDAPAQRDALDLALYILLFPQLIAGPIVRYHEIADQLAWKSRVLRRTDFVAGVHRFAIGLGKKMLIANTVARPADQIFALPASDLTTPTAWLGLFCYTLQIYFDFSGYSDMAIGLARMFGFRFPENFDYPYWAVSVTDFWRRWHMSLSRWFRDYLYIPLGGNRRSTRRTYANLMTVFVLCGLWHGAAWNFLFWGLLHGAALVVERLGLLRLLERAPAALRRASTLCFVMLAWVPFRADTLPAAVAFGRALAGLGHADPTLFTPAEFLDNSRLLAIAVGVLGSTPLMAWLWSRLDARARGTDDEAARPGYVGFAARAAQSAAVVGVLWLSTVQMAANTYNPFIYFRF